MWLQGRYWSDIVEETKEYLQQPEAETSEEGFSPRVFMEGPVLPMSWFWTPIREYISVVLSHQM